MIIPLLKKGKYMKFYFKLFSSATFLLCFFYFLFAIYSSRYGITLLETFFMITAGVYLIAFSFYVFRDSLDK